MESSSPEVEKCTNQLTDYDCDISPEVEMQTELLSFKKVLKSPDKDWHELN